MERKITIKDYFGRTVTVTPRLVLYNVNDIIGRELTIFGIELVHLTDGENEPFEDIITKSFGEFIVAKNCAYMDLNNSPYAKEFLEQGIAKDMGIVIHSGFCEYPLWRFDEDFLRDIGGTKYEQYSDKFNKYMTKKPERNE